MSSGQSDPLPHDSGYKLLFSHPRLVADLLTGFVQPAWLDSSDLNTLEPFKASFTTDDLRQRHDDSIWRVRFNDTWLYLYLLIEFQSGDDHFMANRVMTYIGLLYQDIIRAQELKRGDRLPPVMPIVIYNGLDSWTGPMEVADLIDPVHPALAAFTPKLSYFLLQEKTVPEDYSQRHPDNLVGHLIALGFCRTPEAIRQCIQRLHRQLAAPEYKAIRQTFAIWLSRMLTVRFRTDDIPEFQDLNEVDTMLAQRLDQWTLQWKDEGIKLGARQEAHRLLGKQIRMKYGDLPAWAEERLAQADLDQLEIWAERIFSAESVTELLRDEK